MEGNSVQNGVRVGVPPRAPAYVMPLSDETCSHTPGKECGEACRLEKTHLSGFGYVIKLSPPDYALMISFRDGVDFKDYDESCHHTHCYLYHRKNGCLYEWAERFVLRNTHEFIKTVRKYSDVTQEALDKWSEEMQDITWYTHPQEEVELVEENEIDCKLYGLARCRGDQLLNE